MNVKKTIEKELFFLTILICVGLVFQVLNYIRYIDIGNRIKVIEAKVAMDENKPKLQK